MTNSLPKDFKLYQLRVLGTCPVCNGSGNAINFLARSAVVNCPICKGQKFVATILHEGVTLDILLAKMFEGSGKVKINALVEKEADHNAEFKK